MPAKRRLGVTTIGIVLVVSLLGGWLLSERSQPQPDAVLTTSGEAPYPSIGTNNDLVGTMLPISDLATLDGTSTSTADLFGRPLLINFWYSTCEPCRREMPVLVAAALKYKNTVRFIGLNMNDSAEVARAFADTYGVEYELFTEPTGSFISALGIATAPFTLLVDSKGRIVDQVAGELSASTLESLLARVTSL